MCVVNVCYLYKDIQFFIYQTKLLDDLSQILDRNFMIIIISQILAHFRKMPYQNENSNSA
jgi:hypothetical protein